MNAGRNGADIARALLRKTLQERLHQHRENLAGWQEMVPPGVPGLEPRPPGHLVPSEPDPDERAQVRHHLEGAISELESLLLLLGLL